MTLDKIKGMNLQVGTPIEMTIKEGDRNYKCMGYFRNLENHGESSIVDFVLNQNLSSNYFSERASDRRWKYVHDIKDIKVLEYKNNQGK